MPIEIPERRKPLTPSEAAEYLGYSEGYLAKLRLTGYGPAFISARENGAVRYDPADLDAWQQGNKRTSTSGEFRGKRGRKSAEAVA